MSDADSGGRGSWVLRTTLLALAALGLAGTAAELAIERHWNGFEQLIPWFALAAIGAGLLAVIVRPSPATIWLARACAAVAIVMAPVGVWRHIHANYETAPLDFRYAETWDSMPFIEQVWTAASGGVGPAPVLASGVLLEAGLALAAATIAHPELARSEAERRRSATRLRRAEEISDGR